MIKRYTEVRCDDCGEEIIGADPVFICDEKSDAVMYRDKVHLCEYCFDERTTNKEDYVMKIVSYKKKLACSFQDNVHN